MGEMGGTGAKGAKGSRGPGVKKAKRPGVGLALGVAVRVKHRRVFDLSQRVFAHPSLCDFFVSGDVRVSP